MPEQYSPELYELIGLEIPSFPQKEETFLDVAGVQYRENTISAIYAYFLSHRNKAIVELFRNTLLELINSKKISGERFEFEGDFWCELEYHTGEGRIDILLQMNNGEGTSTGSAIIIENKIFHILANDLKDYLKSVKVENKLGVLLTLRKETIPEEVKHSFVNITHTEWCSAIQQKGIPHTLTPKEYIYLTDFLTNMTGITSSQQSEEAKFFFDHSAKILKAVEVRDRAWDYLIMQLKQTAERMDCRLGGNSSDYRHILGINKQDEVHYAVIIKNIISSTPQLMLIIEIYKSAMAKKADVESVMAKHNYFNLEKASGEGSGWKHIALKTYPITRDNWNNFNEFVYEIIQRDFSEAMQKVIEVVYGK
ncbi:MAG: PD-(D/E)XK nuclease family protein [Bacteroidia bacterium]|jgi:hypothetical protein|nr:PD-(D/E)XK nuclease family protein [Bacteroidia bacterium]